MAKPAWWIRPLLFVAFLYSLVWGLAIVFLPGYIFQQASIELPNHIYIWQTLGVIELVLGFGYLIAFVNPFRHWAPVFIGLMYKLLATGVFLKGAMVNASLMNLTDYVFIDNLIWVIPFTAILVATYRRNQRSDDILIEAFDDDEITLDMFETTEGLDLQEMTHRWPTMVVFLRHFGCTFCREALQDLSAQRAEIEKNGVRILLVHMLEDETEARMQVMQFGPGLADVPMISDPEGILYKKFKLRRGTFWQLLGGKVLFRGVVAGMVKGNGLGKEMGDMMQMPGVFVLHKGEILKKYIHRSSADRPKYTKISCIDQSKAA